MIFEKGKYSLTVYSPADCLDHVTGKTYNLMTIYNHETKKQKAFYLLVKGGIFTKVNLLLNNIGYIFAQNSYTRFTIETNTNLTICN